jgi:hypothetical protein
VSLKGSKAYPVTKILLSAALAAVPRDISSSVTLPCLESLFGDPDKSVSENAKAAIAAIQQNHNP